MNRNISWPDSRLPFYIFVFLLPHPPPIVLGSHPSPFAEQADEITMVAESQGVCDFLDRLVGGVEQQLRPLHLLAVDIHQRRDAELLLEQSDEIRFGDASHISQVVDIDVLVDMAVDMVDDPFHALVKRPHPRFRPTHEP